MIKQIPFKLKLPISDLRFLVSKKAWHGEQWSDDSFNFIKSKIRTQLENVQTCCAYCGLSFKGNKDKQIEHIAPKASYRNPQFTWTLLNLVLSCGYCNDLIVKGTKPTVDKLNKIYKKCTFLIVHPYFDNPNEHYEWENELTQIIIKVKNDSSKAKNSIKMFDLDSSYMSELRAGHFLIQQLKATNPISSSDEKAINNTLNYKY